MELSQIVAVHGLGGLELFLSQRSLLLPLEFFLPLSLPLPLPLSLPLPLPLPFQLLLPLPLSLPLPLPLLLPLRFALPLFFALALSLPLPLPLPLPQLVLQLKPNKANREGDRKRKKVSATGDDTPEPKRASNMDGVSAPSTEAGAFYLSADCRAEREGCVKSPG